MWQIYEATGVFLLLALAPYSSVHTAHTIGQE